MGQNELTQAEQEVLFQLIIRKIASITVPDLLKELVTQALQLMLRRPQDDTLRIKLIQCATDLFVGTENCPASIVQDANRRKLARDCIEILKAAREHRLPRDTLYPANVDASL